MNEENQKSTYTVIFSTEESEDKKDVMEEINGYLKDGWVIDTIKCDGTDEQNCEATLWIYLEKKN